MNNMLLYMSIPILITIGLCIFSYSLGKYARKTPKPGEETARLRQAVENKDKELQEHVTAVESAQKDRSKLLAKIHDLEEENKRLRQVKEPAANIVNPPTNIVNPQKKETPKTIKKVPDTTKSKNTRVLKTMARRTQNVLAAFRKLGKCADKNVYKYTDDEITKIFHTIENNVKRTRELFNAKPGKNNNKFSL